MLNDWTLVARWELKVHYHPQLAERYRLAFEWEKKTQSGNAFEASLLPSLGLRIRINEQFFISVRSRDLACLACLMQ